MSMKRGLGIAYLMLCFVQGVSGVTKTDQEIFSKWIEGQGVLRDCSLRVTLDASEWETLSADFDAYNQTGLAYASFLNNLSAGFFLKKDAALSARGRKKINCFYEYLDGDIASLMQRFKNPLFLKAYPVDENENIDDTVTRCRGFFQFFLRNADKCVQAERECALANRLFEYCFGQSGASSFRSVLSQTSLHPIAKLFYSMMWINLAGEGWIHWHDSCLRALKSEYDQGKEIVYIAGGSDIYQLLKNNIFRIRVIDPMLPSQPTYYAEGWDWLITGVPDAIGDRLLVNVGDKKLVLTRTTYHQSGSFKANLSTGVQVDLPISTTTWTISENDQNIGQVVFERRFCNKNDFQQKPKQAMLMSFNEMYYVILPSDMPLGWGIGADQMSDDIRLYVKQLRNPVHKKTMESIVHAEKSPFKFILLGSCVT